MCSGVLCIYYLSNAMNSSRSQCAVDAIVACVDLSEPAERIRQLEADNARLTGKLTAMTDRSSRLTRDITDFRSFLSRDVVSPGRTQRLEDDCRNLQLKVILITHADYVGRRG